MWAAQFYKFKNPHTFLTSGGLGTMGYGLGAAIGAQVALKDKQVVNIAGDGCFRMNMNELATASRYNIPIIEVIIDRKLGNLSFALNDVNYGIACSEIPKDEELFPTVVLYEKGLEVELI